MTRATAKYISLLALAVVVFHWKTLLTDQFTSIAGEELVNQTYSWLHFWADSIRHGHIPFWDPYAFGGLLFTEEMPFFYPLHLLFALVPFNKNGLISPRFYFEFEAFTRFLGACFMFAMLRELRRSRFAAFIGACAFSMGGMLARLPWLQYVEACIWLPAVFLFLVRALRAESRARALLEASLGGLCLGMPILSGGIQFAMIEGICVLAGAVYYGVVAGDPERRREHWLRTATIAALLFAVAFGTGAAQLLPSFEFGHWSLRAITGGFFPTTEKIPWDRLVSGMWPQSIASGLFPAGAPIGGGEPWAYYVGALPMFFAAVAVWKQWCSPVVRFLTVMAAVVFAYSLGEFSPLFGVLYAIVPYLWMARGASRFVLLISFAVATLSAFGLDTLLERAGRSEEWEPARPFLKWIAILCSAAVFLPMVFSQITLGIWPSFSVLLILGSCAWVFRLTLRSFPRSLRFLMAAFLLFDLTAFNWLPFNKNDLAKKGDEYVQMVTLKQAAAFIEAQPGLDRTRVSVPSEPNIGDGYGVQSLWGGGATTLIGYSHLSPHEDLLNVRYRIKPATTPDPGAIYRDAFWKVYRDSTAFPRAWLVHQTVMEPGDDAAFASIDRGGIDLHRTAIVESPLPAPLGATTTGDSLRFRSYELNGMSLDVHAGGAALVVLSEFYYPGWRAMVNGKAAAIAKVDGGLRGVEVPAGDSRVVLEYVPLPAYAGLALTLATLLGVPAAWFAVRRRRNF